MSSAAIADSRRTTTGPRRWRGGSSNAIHSTQDSSSCASAPMRSGQMIKKGPQVLRQMIERGIETNIYYQDQLGRMVPLLDQNGYRCNFERAPSRLEHVVEVMKRMDANGI